jgi:hypothetical protein
MGGCPTIKGGVNAKGRLTGKHYLIEQSAFESWLKMKEKVIR